MVKCFGRNFEGQLAYGDINYRGDTANQMGDFLPLVSLGDGLTAQSLHIGTVGTCIHMNDGSIKCWGDNQFGQAGQGHVDLVGDEIGETGDYLEPINLGSGVEIQECFDFSPTISPSFIPTLSPTIFSIPSCPISRFSFSNFNCFLTSSQNVKCIGSNTFGKLGYGDLNNRGTNSSHMGDYLPFVNLEMKPISIHVGFRHTCYQLETLEISCWGGNNIGQLGFGDIENRGDGASEMGSYLPIINFGSNVQVQELSVGGFHGMILDEISGDVKTWGYNGEGRLGQGNVIAQIGDEPNQLGDYLVFLNLGTGFKSSHFIMTRYSSFTLADDISTMKSWGYNSNGELGYGHTDNVGDNSSHMGDNLPSINFPTTFEISHFGAGWHHTCLISISGDLACWGQNTNGQLGLGHTNKIGDTVNEMGDYMSLSNVGTGRNVKEYVGGETHSCVLLDNFAIKCFGNGLMGSLGYGDMTNRGNSNNMGDYLPFVNVGEGLKVLSLHLGEDCTCVHLIDDSLKCWGKNDFGQLGLGHTNSTGDQVNEMGDYLDLVNLGTDVLLQDCFDYSPTLAPSISHPPTPINLPSCSNRFSFYHANCVLTSNQQVKCWGSNINGQLGYGDTTNRGDNYYEVGNYLPFVSLDGSPISIHVGSFHVCAQFSSDLDVKCWGRGTDGELGNEMSSSMGDDQNEMGSYLININFGSNVVASDISVGGVFSMMISDEGRIKAWGLNNYGQLGYEDQNNRGNSVNSMGDYLPFVDLGTGIKIIQVGAAYFSSCSLFTTSQTSNVKCFGWNNYGQLGHGHQSDVGDGVNEMGDNLQLTEMPSGYKISKIMAGWYHYAVLTVSGIFYPWGRNGSSQLGLGSSADIGNAPNELGDYLSSTNLGSGRRVVDAQGGTTHSCVLLDNYELKCFGGNENGQLGYGDTSKRGISINDMGNYLPYVNVANNVKAIQIQTGGYLTCATLSDDQMKCWGRNDYGQLGQASTESLGDESNELGDYLPSIDLGSGVRIISCLDYSPTFSPSSQYNPSLTPTSTPTSNPSTFFPTYFPTTPSPSLSYSPTSSPTLGSHLLNGEQFGGTEDDYIFDIVVDSNGDVVGGGNSESFIFNQTSIGSADLFVVKYSSNLTFLWSWYNGF